MYISESNGVTREKFFEDLGITYGDFKGKAKEKALSSDVLAKIITKYPEISSEWLLTGNGEMLKSEVSTEVIKTPRVEIIEPIKVEGRSLMPKVVVVDNSDNDRIPLVSIKPKRAILRAMMIAITLRNYLHIVFLICEMAHIVCFM